MADIFLAYAREDRRRATKLAEVLEQQGWSVWWDRKILTGQTFLMLPDFVVDGGRALKT